MRIVQVVNGLPPEYLGGTETYAAALAQELARQGHDVAVFTRRENARQPEYAVETTTVEQVEIARINNTQRGITSFADSYQNDTIAARFGEMLDRFQPDVVHFQHLVYLSTTCVREVVQRQIPVVMTLHDYWLICQRGRFLKPDLSVCPGQTDAGCARCFHHLLDPKMAVLYRWLKPLLDQQAWLRDRARRWSGKRAGSQSVEAEERTQIDFYNLRLFGEAARVLLLGYMPESVFGLSISTGTVTPAPVSADRGLAG